MAHPNILFILSLLFPLLTFSSSNQNTNPNTITLPLSPLFTKSPSLDLFHSLKTPKSNHNKSKSSSSTNTQIFSRSYGGHSINLNFGTPPQTLSFVLDTGSRLVWFPCSSRYFYSNCNFLNSSTSKVLVCTDPKCGLFFEPDIQSLCGDCNPQKQNCNNISCPGYIVQYGLGLTSATLLLDNLDFPSSKFSCRLFSCI